MPSPINPYDLVKLGQQVLDRTKQPLKQRGSILPIGEYEDGSVGPAWPGLIAAPAEAFKRMAETPMPAINDDDAWRQMALDSFDVGGAAMTGGLATGLAGGLADNAVGSAGGRLGQALEQQAPKGIRGPRLQKSGEFTERTPDFTPMELRALLATSMPEIFGEMVANGGAQYRVARAMGESIPTSLKEAGTLARDVKREALGSWSDQMADAKRGPATQFSYDILGPDDAKIGTATGEVAGDTMFFGWLGDPMYSAQNKLGVGGLRALREQIRADFPNVKRFEGMRVSGAREKLDPKNALQSVYIAANAPTGAAVPLAMEGQQDTDPALLEVLRQYGLLQ